MYKKDLNEQKINLDDDYIKFIRFSEYFIEKNGTGIVAMITNNSFIDGITHRQMRKHLLETFDDIYILDLHGNSKKKEKSPDGSKDENVFDIMQGVSINILVRKNKDKKGLGNVYHSELYGKRESKFKTLDENDVKTTNWKKLKYTEPYYFFVPKNFEAKNEYDNGFKLSELFRSVSSGIESAKDEFIVRYTEKDTLDLYDFIDRNTANEITERYHIINEKATQVKNDFRNVIGKSTRLLYRPFDLRYTLYSPNSQGLWWRPRYDVMKHFVNENLGLIFKRGFDEDNASPIFVSQYIIDRRCWSRAGMQGAEVMAPLYLYTEENLKVTNFHLEILKTLEETIAQFEPEDILDYIYAILHSPSYREKYKEFLKIDFPRVPYPKDKKEFDKYVKYGSELRLLHLMESPKLNKFITTYSIEGSDTVDKITYKDGNVFINSEQFFGNVPDIAWNFYIGGYQPAQKWLKDRKGRTLTNEDIEHYQKIIVILMETGRIMKEIG